MSTAIAEITEPGVGTIPSKDDQKRPRFLAPNSDRVVALNETRKPRKGPTHIKFGFLRNRKLRMLAPINVKLERKGETVVASWEEEFGYGRNVSEALDDFGRVIEELFISLREQKDRLGGDMLALRDKLARYIEFRD